MFYLTLPPIDFLSKICYIMQQIVPQTRGEKNVRQKDSVVFARLHRWNDLRRLHDFRWRLRRRRKFGQSGQGHLRREADHRNDQHDRGHGEQPAHRRQHDRAAQLGIPPVGAPHLLLPRHCVHRVAVEERGGQQGCSDDPRRLKNAFKKAHAQAGLFLLSNFLLFILPLLKSKQKYYSTSLIIKSLPPLTLLSISSIFKLLGRIPVSSST